MIRPFPKWLQGELQEESSFCAGWRTAPACADAEWEVENQFVVADNDVNLQLSRSRARMRKKSMRRCSLGACCAASQKCVHHHAPGDPIHAEVIPNIEEVPGS